MDEENSQLTLSIAALEKLPEKERKNFYRSFASKRWKVIDNLPERLQQTIILAEEIKFDIKLGKTSFKEQQKVHHLYNILHEQENNKANSYLKNSLKDARPTAYYQIMAVLSEQFYRWHDIEKARHCVEEGREILDKIIAKNRHNSRNVLNGKADEIKEKIRFCLAYIQAFSYHSSDNDKYQKTLNDLKECRDYILNRAKIKNIYWNGTLAAIESYLGRCYRNKLQYHEANKSFGRSIGYYEKRRAEADPSSSYRDSLYAEVEEIFVHHRMSLVLILGYGWMNIQHGHLYKALYNDLLPAKALLANMNDELANTYLALLETSAIRWLSLPKYVRNDLRPKDTIIFEPEEALAKARKVSEVCDKLGIRQFSLHAIYEEAMCYEYCEQWQDSLSVAEKMIKEAVAAKDIFWSARAYLLKGRVLTRQFYHEGKKDKKIGLLKNSKKNKQNNQRELDPFRYFESEIYPVLNKARVYAENSSQTILEYHLYYGEAYLTAHDNEQALAAFETALSYNRPSNSKSPSDYLNPKIEASCRLRIAKIYLRRREFLAAEQQLRIWNEDLANEVDDMYLHYLAERIKAKLELPSRADISIKTIADLNYTEQKRDLQKILLTKAFDLFGEGANLDEVRKKLNISKKTFDDWRENYQIKPPKRNR